MKKYVVTGVTRDGKRFRPIRTNSYVQATGINLYRGTVWEVQPDGTRKKIKQVWN